MATHAIMRFPDYESIFHNPPAETAFTTPSLELDNASFIERTAMKDSPHFNKRIYWFFA